MEANEFKRLLLPYHKLLYSIALRISGNEMDAEDIVQETYIRLWKQRDKLEAITNAKAYAVTTLRHVCFDSLASRPPDGTVTQLDDSVPEPMADRDTASDIEHRETSALVHEIIDRLPSPQREILEMRDLEDMPYDRIEQATGLSQGNIRVTLFRARRQFKELLKSYSRL